MNCQTDRSQGVFPPKATDVTRKTSASAASFGFVREALGEVHVALKARWSDKLRRFDLVDVG